MRHRWWIAALSTAALLGLTLPAQAIGLKKFFHPKERAKEKEENRDLMLSCIQQKAWLACASRITTGRAFASACSK